MNGEDKTWPSLSGENGLTEEENDHREERGREKE